jgi:hypothetical protein
MKEQITTIKPTDARCSFEERFADPNFIVKKGIHSLSRQQLEAVWEWYENELEGERERAVADYIDFCTANSSPLKELKGALWTLANVFMGLAGGLGND